MNYNELTDFEINKLVAIKWLPERQHDFIKEKNDRHEGMQVFHLGEVYDPCNNPSDAWPIILENEISIIPNGGNWAATNSIAWHDCDNPLRAAMIVYLMMGDE